MNASTQKWLLREEQARRDRKMAATHGVGAALALAVEAQQAHAVHTARHERHFNCEFCELADLEAAAAWKLQQYEELTLTGEELVREHRGW